MLERCQKCSQAIGIAVVDVLVAFATVATQAKRLQIIDRITAALRQGYNVIERRFRFAASQTYTTEPHTQGAPLFWGMRAGGVQLARSSALSAYFARLAVPLWISFVPSFNVIFCPLRVLAVAIPLFCGEFVAPRRAVGRLGCQRFIPVFYPLLSALLYVVGVVLAFVITQPHAFEHFGPVCLMALHVENIKTGRTFGAVTTRFRANVELVQGAVFVADAAYLAVKEGKLYNLHADAPISMYRPRLRMCNHRAGFILPQIIAQNYALGNRLAHQEAINAS